MFQHNLLKNHKKIENQKKNSRIEAHHCIFLVSLIVILTLFLCVPSVFAADFDNIIDYSDDNKIVTFKNWYGLGATLGTAELITPQVNYVIRGENRQVMIFKIENYGNDYTNGLTDMLIINMFNQQEENKDYHFEYAVPYEVDVEDEEYICVDSKTILLNGSASSTKCSWVITGTHKETRERWIRLENSIIPKGNITIALVTDVYPGDHYDGIPILFGKQIDEWAEWEDSLTIGLSAYYRLNETTGTVAPDSSPTQENNMTEFGTEMSDANWIEQGIVNRAINFTYNRNQSIAITNLSTGINVSSENWTINFWYYGNGTAGALGSFGGVTDYHAVAFDTTTTSINYLAAAQGSSGPWDCTQTVNVQLGTPRWRMFTLVRNSTTFVMYNNGTSIASCNDVGEHLQLGGQNTLRFGNAYGNGSFWSGRIDEIGFWNRSLLTSEVVHLFNNGTGLTNPTTTTTSFVTFTNISYSPTIQSSLTSYFGANITFNNTDYDVITTWINYNYTNYSTTTIGTGLSRIYSTNVQAPIVTTSTNIPFYWIVGLTNVTGTNYYISSSNNQLVNAINMSILGKPYSKPFINFSIYNQDTLESINASFKATFNYGLSTLTNTLTYENDSEYFKSFTFSFDDNDSYYNLSGTIEVSRTGYTTNLYTFPRTQVSSAVTNISLYLVNSSLPTSFVVKVRDSSYDNVIGAIVYIQRYYPGTDEWLTTEILTTNSEGKAVGHFITEDYNYRFLVYVDEVLELTSIPTKIFCEVSPCTIILTLPTTAGSAVSQFENLTNYSGSLTYDDSTFIFTFTYADSNADSTGGRLYVIRRTFAGLNDVAVCSNNNTANSAVITCDISAQTNGTYIATGYISRTGTGEFIVHRIIIEKVRDIISSIGLDGLLWAVFLFMGIVMIGLVKPPVAVIVALFGVIFLRLIGLASIPILSLTAIFAIGIVLLWEMRK